MNGGAEIYQEVLIHFKFVKRGSKKYPRSVCAIFTRRFQNLVQIVTCAGCFKPLTVIEIRTDGKEFGETQLAPNLSPTTGSRALRLDISKEGFGPFQLIFHSPFRVKISVSN